MGKESLPSDDGMEKQNFEAGYFYFLMIWVYCASPFPEMHCFLFCFVFCFFQSCA